MFKVTTTVQPVTEPVTLAEVKAKLMITDTDNDTRLTALISAVRNNVENYCGIAIGSQTKEWVYDFDSSPVRSYGTFSAIRDSWQTVEKKIPYGPIISVTTVSRRESDMAYTALTVNDDYRYADGVLYGVSGINKVVYVTGMTTIPPALKEGILTEIAYRYENYGDENKEGFSVEALDYIIKFKDFSWE